MSKLFDLTGQKAIVTGGTRGIGRAMAEALHDAGAELVIFGTRPAGADVAREIGACGAPVSYLQADLGNIAGLPAVFEQALSLLHGKLDILINAAGVQYREKSEDFPLDAWQQVLDVNLTAIFRLCQLAAKVMIPQHRGKIINLSSMLAFFGGYTVPAYAASKGAVAQLTKAFSNEWAKHGINVNAIAPGYIDTDMNVNLMNNPERNEKILARISAGRWGTPRDLQGIAVFLASEASDYVSGAVIPIDGGYLGN